jgi:hypothetical protein
LVVQAPPRAQATQAAFPSQKPPLHGVPSVRFVVVSTHDCAPVAHDSTPALQGVGLFVHVPPCVHATQALELLQTMFTPQLWPVPRAVVVSLHTATPVAQSVLPPLQGEGFVVHAAIDVHALHAPVASQTWFVPQLLPTVFS